jgi:hypothetical protein
VATDIRPSSEPKTKGYSYVMMETQPAEPYLQCYNLKYVLLQMTVNVHCEVFLMNIAHISLDNHCISFHCMLSLYIVYHIPYHMCDSQKFYHQRVLIGNTKSCFKHSVYLAVKMVAADSRFLWFRSWLQGTFWMCAVL